jgi:methylenetetrahydrofolate reductase (NADPH)
MKITKHILKSKKTLFSFEIIPPLKGKKIKNLFFTLNRLIELNPSFIYVTCHRNEFIHLYNGLLEKKISSNRPGTIGICSFIINKYKINSIPHLLCQGFNKQIIEDFLINLNYLGIDNILVIRGDIKNNILIPIENNEYKYTIELIKKIKNFNKKLNICIGIAGYPEKHFESQNKEKDFFILKKKVEKGAKYILTQMFFDNEKYFNFVNLCRKMKINIPIIPGIKPIYNKDQLKKIPSSFYISLPIDLIKEIKKAKNNKIVNQIGIEWAIMQSKELKKSGVDIIHYYTMGKSENIYNIIKSVF